jgi:hypothetical protein
MFSLCFSISEGYSSHSQTATTWIYSQMNRVHIFTQPYYTGRSALLRGTWGSPMITMRTTVLWNMTPYSLISANVLVDHLASIFRAEKSRVDFIIVVQTIWWHVCRKQK